MKNILILVFSSLLLWSCNAQESGKVYSSDVVNFWKAYDMIQQTQDSAEQYRILQTEFLDKGTEGLEAIMEKKRYSAEEYIMAINTYPSFWNSVRDNTLKSGAFAEEIEAEILKLKNHYPDLRPANIYFTIGTLRTGGTAHEGHVLIGSESALGDSTLITKDIEPAWLGENMTNFYKTNPIEDVVLLNVHEYVHTQQEDYGYDLLSQSIYEGVAEFVSVLSHGGPSSSPAIKYGKDNEEKLRTRFEQEMFSPQWNDWLYNNTSNEFGVRDLGYAVGYQIIEKYYNKSADKNAAIKRMIELDYQNRSEMEAFAEESGYFTTSIEILKLQYEESRPQIVQVSGIQNGAKDVLSSTDKITIHFSEEMSDRFRNQRIGPLGLDNLLPVIGVNWSEDMKAITFHVELEPNKRYQLEIDNQYRSVKGPVIDKYLIDFKTAN